MKKIIRVLLCFLILFAGYFLFNRYYSSNTMPSFEYVSTDNALFTKESLPKNRRTVFIYFSTDCSDCRIINDYLDDFKSKSDSVNFVLVSKGKDTRKLIGFIDTNKMSDFKGYLLLDKNDDFGADFALGISYSYPVIKAYDKDGASIKSIKTLNDIKRIEKVNKKVSS